MDPNIILSGQPLNMLGIMEQSNRMAENTLAARRQDEYRNMLSEHGAGIARGDQGALDIFASYDPGAALGIMQTRQGMQQADQRMSILSAQEKRAAEEYARGLSAEARAAEAAQIENAVKMGLMIPDAATWDQTMGSTAPDLVGQFDNRQALAARYMSMADVLKQVFPEPLKPTSSQNDYQFYVQQESQAGRPVLSFNDWDNQSKKAGATTVNVGAGESEFDKAMGKADAELLTTASTAGIAAQRNLARIDELGALLSKAPTGAAGMFAQMAGNWGLDVGGAGEVQAAQAMINSLVPEQRQPGSGPMSDADLELFKQSLPRIINQPGGNQIILDTMRAIAMYDAQGAEIVQRTRLPEGDPNRLTRGEAIKALQDRPDPMANFKAGQSSGASATGSASNPAASGPAQIGSKADYDALPSGAEYVAPDGSRRRKP